MENKIFDSTTNICSDDCWKNAKEINNNRIENNYSLLYLVCKKRNVHIFLNLMKVNEFSNKLLINVNVQNKKDKSTSLHGLLWGENDNIGNHAELITIIIRSLIKNCVNKTIINNFGELPIDNIRLSPKQILIRARIMDLLQ